MAKRYKVVNPLQSGTSIEFLTDWSKCIFCQEDLSEKLHCPAESRRNTMGAGYKTTSDLLMDFSRTGCLPKTMDLSRFDDGNGIEAAFVQHKAKWHDSCRLKYNKTGRDQLKTWEVFVRSLLVKSWERQVLHMKHASSGTNKHMLESL